MITALERGEWSAARPSRTLPPGKNRYPLYRRLGGPQGLSGRAQNLAPPEFDPWTIQPVVSRYSDWATRPTVPIKTHNFNLHHFAITNTERNWRTRTEQVRCYLQSISSATSFSACYKWPQRSVSEVGPRNAYKSKGFENMFLPLNTTFILSLHISFFLKFALIFGNGHLLYQQT